MTSDLFKDFPTLKAIIFTAAPFPATGADIAGGAG